MIHPFDKVFYGISYEVCAELNRSFIKNVTHIHFHYDLKTAIGNDLLNQMYTVLYPIIIDTILNGLK